MRTPDHHLPQNLSAEIKEKIQAGLLLPLMEQFYTLQGEGAYMGEAASFIRVGGCDVGCHWCDVKESWDAGLHAPTPVSEIVEEALKYPARTIVITGGEPLMYNMGPLTQALKNEGFQIHLETSGAYPLTGSFDWICLSPKKNIPPLTEIYPLAQELKVIVYNQHDFVWAEGHADRLKACARKYLQPEWSKREKMIPEIIRYVQAYPQWRISLQSHKYLHIP